MTPAFGIGILVGIALTVAALYAYLCCMDDADTILCTHQNVVAAVLKEYRAAPRLREVSPERIISEPRLSAERIADNLIQITEQKKGAKTA